MIHYYTELTSRINNCVIVSLRFIYVCGYHCPSVAPFVYIFMFLCIGWQITWKESPKIWHADVPIWLTSIRNRCRWEFLSFHAFVPPSVQLSVSLGFGIPDKSLRKKSISGCFGLTLLTLVGIIFRLSDRSPLFFFRFLCIWWQIIWKGWHKNWHVDVSRWFSLGRHRCQQTLLSFHSFVNPSDHPWEWVWLLQTNCLEGMAYVLACWCTQIGIIAHLFIRRFQFEFGFVGGWLLLSLGDTGDICCHYCHKILVQIMIPN